MRREQALARLLAAATAPEQQFLAGLLLGELRQGALDSLVRDALAAATGTPLATVRRAAMLAGGTVEIAEAAVSGGAAALEGIGLEVGRPVLPMLASSAPDVAAAVAKVADMPEIDRLVATLEIWWSAIEVLIITGVTNARTEGFNRIIKQTKRVGCGFTNMDNYRRRIMVHIALARGQRPAA